MRVPRPSLPGERSLRPLLAVQLLAAVAFTGLWNYVGIWAVEALGARPSSVGLLFLFDATAAAASGYLGGRLSDRIGRKPGIVAGFAGEAAAAVALLFVGHDVVLGFAVLAFAGAASGPALAGLNAIVADLTEPGTREDAYAAVRVASNLGAALGPAVGGVMIAVGSWTAFLVGVAVLGTAAVVVCQLALPSPPPLPAEDRRAGSLRAIFRDRAFALLLLSTLLGFMVYVAFESVLPVVAVASYGLAASTWGFIVVVNPVLVVLFQLRITRWTAAWPVAPKLAFAMALMGFPFLLLLGGGPVPLLVTVIVIFVIGEMLWIPTSQALAAEMAPEAVRGAYMGALGTSASVAWMLGPLAGLQIRAAAGNTGTWIFFAALALAGAAAGAAAARAAAIDRAYGGRRAIQTVSSPPP